MAFKMVDGERVEITDAEAAEIRASWEFRRDADGNPEGRKVAGDGTVIVDWGPVPEEPVTSEENRQVRESLDAEALAAQVASNPAGERFIKLLVALGAMTVEQAESAGVTL